MPRVEQPESQVPKVTGLALFAPNQILASTCATAIGLYADWASPGKLFFPPKCFAIQYPMKETLL